MANAQILLLALGAIPADALRSAVLVAGRTAGFAVAGPSTYASGTSVAMREISSNPLSGVFTEGPWAGSRFVASSPLGAGTTNVPWSAIRMNLLNGPAEVRLTSEAATAPPTPLERVGNALVAMPSTIRYGSRTPARTISWDRGIPAALPLEESATPGSSGGGGGFLLGLSVVAALAWFAKSGVR